MFRGWNTEKYLKAMNTYCMFKSAFLRLPGGDFPGLGYTLNWFYLLIYDED